MIAPLLHLKREWSPRVRTDWEGKWEEAGQGASFQSQGKPP